MHTLPFWLTSLPTSWSCSSYPPPPFTPCMMSSPCVELVFVFLALCLKTQGHSFYRNKKKLMFTLNIHYHSCYFPSYFSYIFVLILVFVLMFFPFGFFYIFLYVGLDKYLIYFILVIYHIDSVILLLFPFFYFLLFNFLLSRSAKFGRCFISQGRKLWTELSNVTFLSLESPSLPVSPSASPLIPFLYLTLPCRPLSQLPFIPVVAVAVAVIVVVTLGLQMKLIRIPWCILCVCSYLCV